MRFFLVQDHSSWKESPIQITDWCILAFVTPVITAASILNSIPVTWLQLPKSPAGQEQYALTTSPPGHSSVSFCIMAQTSYGLEETRCEGTHLAILRKIRYWVYKYLLNKLICKISVCLPFLIFTF